MHRQQQHMIFNIHAEQTRAHERAVDEVEGLPEVLDGETMRFCLPSRLRQVRQIKQRQCQSSARRNDLHWLCINHLKCCAQNLVPLDDLVQCLFDSLYVESPQQTRGDGHVISRTLRVHLLQEPESLLCKRQRKEENVL